MSFCETQSSQRSAKKHAIRFHFLHQSSSSSSSASETKTIVVGVPVFIVRVEVVGVVFHPVAAVFAF